MASYRSVAVSVFFVLALGGLLLEIGCLIGGCAAWAPRFWMAVSASSIVGLVFCLIAFRSRS